MCFHTKYDANVTTKPTSGRNQCLALLVLLVKAIIKKTPVAFSPHANSTDRATAAYQRS
jgi:hypothetical protein